MKLANKNKYDDLSNKKLARKVSRDPRYKNTYTSNAAEKLGRDEMIRLLDSKVTRTVTGPEIREEIARAA